MGHKVIVEIELGNEAMQNGYHVAAALHELADTVDGSSPDAGQLLHIRDHNGNKVGTYKVVVDIAEPLRLLYKFRSGESPNDGSGRKHSLKLYQIKAGEEMKLIAERSEKFVSEWQMAREVIKDAGIMPPEAFRPDGTLMAAWELREAGIAIVESI